MTIGFFSFILGTQDYKTKGLNVYLLDLTNLGKTNIVLGLAVFNIIFYDWFTTLSWFLW